MQNVALLFIFALSNYHYKIMQTNGQKQYPDEVIETEKKVYIKKVHAGTIARPFNRAYLKLNSIDRISVRDAIMKRARITKMQNFGDYKNGRQVISIERQDIIESIFRAYNLDAWTGKQLNNN